jgi:hypothetical protein
MTKRGKAYAVALGCDCVLLFFAIPFARYTMIMVRMHGTDRLLMVMLLIANLLLLLLCFIGLSAWGYAFFHSFRATQAKVLSDTTAINKKSTVSSKTTPAN